MRLVKRLRRFSKDIRGFIVAKPSKKIAGLTMPAVFLWLLTLSTLLATGLILHMALNKPKIVKAPLPTMNIGLTRWPGYAAIYVGLEKGIFRQAGVNVVYHKYDSVSQESKDYISGKLDARGNLITDALVESDSGLQHKIILAIDYSNGADALLAQDNVKSVSQLKGRRVAYEKNTISEFFLRHVLERYNLSISDIISVPATNENVAIMLANRTVDAAVSTDPFVTNIMEASYSKVLFSSAQTPGLIVDVLSMRKDYLNKNHDAAQRFVDGYFASLAYMNHHPKESESIIAKALNVSESDARESLAKVQLISLKGNNLAFTFAAGDQSLYPQLHQPESFLESTHQLTNMQTDIDDIIEAGYVHHVVGL